MSRQQQQLAAVSARVKNHEMTHLAVLGGAAGSGISYDYVIGPDGTRYAVGGSIKVDLQPVPGNPRATLQKARQIRMAALAVGDPSAADMRIAAKAYRMEQEALDELAEERRGASGEEGTHARDPLSRDGEPAASGEPERGDEVPLVSRLQGEEEDSAVQPRRAGAERADETGAGEHREMGRFVDMLV